MSFPKADCKSRQLLGATWLTALPRHWRTGRLTMLVDLRTSNVDKKTNPGESHVRLCNYVDVYKNSRITNSLPFMKAAASRVEIERFRLEVGDVLVTKDSESWDDIGVPSLVTEATDDLVCGYHLAILRPKSAILGAFLYWGLESGEIASQFHVRAKGVTRYGLSHSAFQAVRIPLPPLPEQRAIARYLDYMDRRIQQYIKAKERLIELLEEQKRAVINQAVTRGLDPDVPLKPSGVEWLGDIPAHWEVSRVKNEFTNLNSRRIPLSSVERGAMKKRLYEYYGASGVIDRVDDYLFDDELLLIAEDGANLVMRNLPLALIARGKFWVNNHAHVLKPKRGNLGYLAAVLENLSYAPWISGAAQPKLTQDRLMNIAIAVPSKTDQDQVIASIEPSISKIKCAVVNARRQIELMNEYRTRLIADVVTGKLDVRDAAANLPDGVEEDESSDRSYDPNRLELAEVR